MTLKFITDGKDKKDIDAEDILIIVFFTLIVIYAIAYINMYPVFN